MTKGVIRGELVGVRTQMSPWSVPVAAQLPVRPVGPAAPSGLTATGATESIVLTWTAPTTKADGTALKQGALFGFNVYVSDTSGIDISNPATYDSKEFVDAERYIFTIPDPSTYLGPYYFVVTAVDISGNESAASSEVSASGSQQTAAPVVDDWATGNVESVLVGRGRIFLKFRLPKSSWVRFACYKVYYDVDTGGGFSGAWTYIASERVGFMHSPLNESYKYKYKVTVLAEDGTETSGTINDNAGAGYQPNATDQSNLLADTVAAQHIIATYDLTARTLIGGVLQSLNWGASAGTQFDLDNGTFYLGGSSDPKLSWDGNTLTVKGTIQAGSYLAGSGVISLDASGLDVGTSGSIRGGQTAYNTGTGFWLGYDGGAYKLSIGNPSGHRLTWDGSTLTVEGNLVTDSVDVGTTGYVRGGQTAYNTGTGFWMGYSGGTHKLSIGNPSGNRITWDGSTLSIEGTVTITGGTGVANLSDAGALATLDVVGTAQIDDLAVTTAKIADAAITTAKIGDLQVTGAKIANATIGSAKITDLTFDKITAGTNTASLIIGSGGYIKSSNYSAGSAGFIIYGNGNAEFNNVTMRGSVITGSGSQLNAEYLTAGTITGITYQTATSGRRIYMSCAPAATWHSFIIYNDAGYCAVDIGMYSDSGNIYLRDASGTTKIELQAFNGTITASKVIGALQYSGAQIFNGDSPTSWTDRDVSNIVGTRRALCLLRVRNNGTLNNQYQFRPNGDTVEQSQTCEDFPGAFSTRCEGSGAARNYNYVWVMTGTDGVFEWRANNVRSTTIWLLAYIS